MCKLASRKRKYTQALVARITMTTIALKSSHFLVACCRTSCSILLPPKPKKNAPFLIMFTGAKQTLTQAEQHGLSVEV